MNNLELISKSWFWLEQHKNDEIALGQFADLLIANKPELAKYRRKIILFLKKIDYKDVLFNGEIGKGKLEVDGVSCCWLWSAGKINKYGQFLVENKSDIYPLGQMTYAHRFMLFLVHPDFKLDSESEACHRCDNPPCCNPNHLWPGTHQDNIDDMVNKSRQATGINAGMGILTDDQAWAIFNDTSTQEVIAAEYDVSPATISLIKRGERQLTDKAKSLPKNQNTRSLQSKSGHHSKVTKEIIEEVKKLKASGNYTNVQLSIEFNLSNVTIGNILRDKNLKRFD